MRTPRRGQPGGGSAARRPPRRPEAHAPGAAFLYGRNAVAEALRGRRRPRALLLAHGINEDDRIRDIVRTATAARVAVERLPRPQLDGLLGPVNHQGIALDAGPYPYVSLEEAFSESGTILALDHLQDPRNLGTLLRAADAAGVVGVLIPTDRAADVTPAVANASSGAVEHLKVAKIPNLARALDQAKEAGWWVAGLDVGEGATDLYETDLPSPLALVVGSEGSGIGPNVRKRCDLLLSIPMTGKVASLNAATAGSIALFELVRRTRTAMS